MTGRSHQCPDAQSAISTTPRFRRPCDRGHQEAAGRRRGAQEADAALRRLLRAATREPASRRRRIGQGHLGARDRHSARRRGNEAGEIWKKVLQDVTTGDGSYDLYTHSWNNIGDLVSAKGALNLDDFVAKYHPDWGDPERGTPTPQIRELLYKYNGSNYRRVSDGDFVTWQYRKDLMADDGHRKAFQSRNSVTTFPTSRRHGTKSTTCRNISTARASATPICWGRSGDCRISTRASPR